MTAQGQDFTLWQGSEKTLSFDATVFGGGLSGGSNAYWFMQRAADDPTDQVYKTLTINTDNDASVILSASDTTGLQISGESDDFYHYAGFTNSSGKHIALCEGTVTLKPRSSQTSPTSVELDEADIITIEIQVVGATIITA